ncbi:MAG: competence/damage-inducible protein A [Pyrinomonadaceae bacterium]|nr:competence/damage-inducible protein A [Pyrinomonadaceae bacterium]
MLSAEIIAIGSELLTPTKTDTNSLWLTEKLNEIGIDVKLKTVVGDDELRLEEAVKDAIKRSDVIITTGGLGPTEDDITRTVTANAVGRELLYHNELENELRERFLGMGREMPEINKRQAFIIEGARILPNPNGSASGMLVEVGEKFLAVLPGPPRELKPMFENHVLPELSKLRGGVVFRKQILKVSGMGESAIDEAIAPIYSSYEKVRTSILFNKSDVEVHLTAQASSAREADILNNEIAQKIVRALGNAVFSTKGEEMEEVVGNLLKKMGKTLSTAESCTGGLIAGRITEVSGSSAYFIEGAVTYSNDAKMRTLNVPAEMLEKHGAVSAEVAEAMARGMRERARTDYAVAVTGIAGPDGGTEEKPVGTVYIGYADEDKVTSRKIIFPGDRYLIRWRTSQAALEILRRNLIKGQNE